MDIKSFAQEIPQLASGYPDRSLAGHGENLLSCFAIEVWQGQVLVSVERVTIDFVEPGLEIRGDTFVDVGLPPMQCHPPFSRSRLIGGEILALEHFAWNSDLGHIVISRK
jgi:hypothetical protein